MPDKPVIARQTPCIVEVGSGSVFGVNAVDRKCSRFAMDPLRGWSFRRWRFALKRRNAWRSVAVSRRKSLPSVMGLTRGSNHVVLAANPHSECERLGGSLGASPRFTQTGAVQSKGMRYLVSMEEASSDAIAR
jgi:hypothetical protein